MADLRRLAKRVILIGGWMLAATFAQAQPVIQPQDSGNAALELRVNQLASELRCLVCQNQTIADSNADLALDLRREIRGMIQQGKSDREILDFMVARYGDFVLYRPPVQNNTALLWFGPLLILVVGLVALVRYLRRRNVAATAAAGGGLSEAERRRAETLLQEAAASDKKDSAQ